MAEPHWLTPEEDRLWRTFIKVSIGTVQSIESDLKRDTGLSRDDYEVLVHLSEAADHQLRMSELSDELHNSRSRLTQRIDRMVDRGLVQRVQDPEDRRKTFACITPKGLETIAQAAPHHVESVRALLLDHLTTAEITELADLLKKIQANLR